MTKLEDIDFSGFENALKTLKDAINKGSLNDLERDGAIQRYEYTFELAWKMMRKVLIAMGRSEVSASPRPVLRDAMEEGFIADATEWFAFLEARNLSTHICDNKGAESVFLTAKKFLPAAERLLLKFKDLK